MTMWWEMTLRVYRWHLSQWHRRKCIYLRGTQHNRCCACVKTRTNAYRETWLHLFARSARDSLQLRTNWSQSNRNDTVLTRTRAVGYRVPPQRLPLKGGRSRWKQTRGIHQSSSPFPSSSSRFRCMAVRLWHANKRLFLFSSPLQEKVESKMRSRASNGLVTMENRSLLISFFHSLGFLSQSPHSAGVGRWQWEGLKGGMRARSGECCVRVSASWWHISVYVGEVA